jgi:hypothetical protein
VWPDWHFLDGARSRAKKTRHFNSPAGHDGNDYDVLQRLFESSLRRPGVLARIETIASGASHKAVPPPGRKGAIGLALALQARISNPDPLSESRAAARRPSWAQCRQE